MRKIIQNIFKQTQIDNIIDAIVTSVNVDGTYDLQLGSGAIKKRAIDISGDVTIGIGDSVNISMVSGNKETAKILGKRASTTRRRQTFNV